MTDQGGAESMDTVDTVVTIDAGAQGDSADVDGVEVIDPVAEKATMELKTQALQNPKVLAALQDHLENLVGQRSGYIESLPKVVKRRIKALKNYQVKYTQMEAKFYEEVHQLECKYAKMYEGLFEKRREVVTGAVEPTDSDCEWESSDEEEEDTDEKVNTLAGDLKDKAKLDEDKEEESAAGIPDFWLTILRNVETLSDMIQDHDEAILTHLEDIRVKFHEGVQMGFTLEFHFSPNDSFTNTVLTKSYQMRSEPDESDPFSFEGPEIISSSGCTIDWKKGKNVTMKLIKKKQKHKGKGTTRMVTKTVQNDSFFNFFSPPKGPEEGAEVDEETENLLSADFEIGHFIRERIIPRAVLYFTGEAIEDDEYEEEGEEEDAEGEEGDEEDENDPDYDHTKDSKPQECKSQ
ncbi:nucleosome assembly protein 1-like 1 isoform X1 [Asterias rubens]|uniref:nucleosome assembly protein 1-like 1 isoform X1 n=1 Tax=Asterias rubens TaxID=7604 RepID=UPI001454F539|nr:nucleosome assembly protein 1-like 1 isoform X1 [Asterias rubens]XP_033646060.1 nucleosome assembly protein 1-like 1 isoform X1 [Asterias rubens]XP_033646061.1 nucleosome assembly protein 1-like 1 isoform X1 [Asterias rubens]